MRSQLDHSAQSRVAFDITGCDDDFKSLLFSHVQSYPAIWDVNLRLYRDGNSKANAWNEIASDTNSNRETFKKVWETLRDT